MRLLAHKVTPLIRPDFRYSKMVKYYTIVHLKRGHLLIAEGVALSDVDYCT
jgi:hypothetical protein